MKKRRITGWQMKSLYAAAGVAAEKEFPHNLRKFFAGRFMPWIRISPKWKIFYATAPSIPPASIV